MEITEGLQKLIDAAVADGKISKKERAILLKRSEKDGLDNDEFNMYLDSLVIKGPRGENKIISFLKWVFAKKLRAITFFLFLIVIWFGGKYLITIKEANDLAELRGGENFGDCLSKSKFEGARLYNSELRTHDDVGVFEKEMFGYSYVVDIDVKHKNLVKIITAEIPFFISNDA